MKTSLKTLFAVISVLLVSPLLCSYFLITRCVDADTALETHSQILSLLPGKLGSYLRVAFYRFTLAGCDSTATICFGVLFSKSDAVIEANVYIGPRCILGSVHLQQDVLLGPCVQIPSGPNTHGTARLDIPIRLQPGIKRMITIGRDSWIGASAIIMADVASQNVIGAASVVTHETQPASIHCGVPARLVRSRADDSSQSRRKLSPLLAKVDCGG